jgi:sugar phosphate isomerase/epimerase
MNIDGHTIGVCSWSLHPRDTAELIAHLQDIGVNHVQLALVPLTKLDDRERDKQVDQLRAANIQLTGGMLGFADEDYSSIAHIRDSGGFIPDRFWTERKQITRSAAALAKRLGAPHVLAHVGFVPPHGDAGYQPAVARIREVADLLDEHGVGLVMETGQEPAEGLLAFLQDLNRPNVAINFDPANMILYGAGEPIAAIKTLGQFIRHVHVKDATASSRPGVEWGAEVPFGTGQVGASRFLQALKYVNYTGPLCIEREAGEQRVADIKFAIETLKSAAK